jgi:hypothetical protein
MELLSPPLAGAAAAGLLTTIFLQAAPVVQAAADTRQAAGRREKTALHMRRVRQNAGAAGIHQLERATLEAAQAVQGFPRRIFPRR